MTTLIFNIDIKAALAVLKKLNKSVDDTGKKADDSFGRARDELGRFIATGEKGSKKLEKGFGGVGGAISSLSTGLGGLVVAFGAVSVAGVAAFAAVTAGGIALNKEAESTRIALIQIFEGNEGAADAFISTVGDLAVKLGTSRQELTGFAKGILPDVGTIEGTTDLLENVIILSKDAGAQIDDVRRTLEGALVGDFQGFQDVLNIPPPTITKIKNLAKEIGNAAAITQVLGDRIQDQGLSVEAFAGTLDTLENQLLAQFEDYQKILGVAPYEELKEQANEFLAVLEEQGPEIAHVAEAFGDFAAKVIDFIGTNLTGFIENIDFQAVEGLVDGLSDAVDAGELLLDVFFDLDDGSLFNNLIAGLTTVVNKIKEVATTAAQITAIAKAENAQALAEIEILGHFGLFADAETKARAATAGQIAFDQSIRDSLPAFEKFSEAEKENTRIRKDRRKVIEDTTEADKAAGEAVLANKKALDELATAQKEAADAQEVISKKTADLEEDAQKRQTDIQRKEAQKRFDDEVKNAQKREDIAAKNAEAIEDIARKQDQAIADAGKDLTREEQDIARAGARDRLQIERGAAQARVDVERDFRQQLQGIQRQFNQSAQDAERNNDAQAFLQAVRARDEQIDVAKSERDVSIGDVDRGAQQQREDLKTQLAQEVEDSKVANVRKLEDLQGRLNQEIEAQAIKNELDIEQQAIQEQRQQEQRDLAARRTLENFERSQAEKEAKLNESLEKQFAILQVAKEKEVALVAQAEADKTKIVVEEMERRAKALAEAEEESAQTDAPALAAGINQGGGLTPMAAGGPIAAGQSAIVGEGGPEVFTAPASGRIVPNQTMFSPPGSPLGAGASVNNSRSLNVEQMGINPGDGILSRMVQNEMSKMLEMLG